MRLPGHHGHPCQRGQKGRESLPWGSSLQGEDLQRLCCLLATDRGSPVSASLGDPNQLPQAPGTSLKTRQLGLLHHTIPGTGIQQTASPARSLNGPFVRRGMSAAPAAPTPAQAPLAAALHRALKPDSGPSCSGLQTDRGGGLKRIGVTALLREGDLLLPTSPLQICSGWETGAAVRQSKSSPPPPAPGPSAVSQRHSTSTGRIYNTHTQPRGKAVGQALLL